MYELKWVFTVRTLSFFAIIVNFKVFAVVCVRFINNPVNLFGYHTHTLLCETKRSQPTKHIRNPRTTSEQHSTSKQASHTHVDKQTKTRTAATATTKKQYSSSYSSYNYRTRVSGLCSIHGLTLFLLTRLKRFTSIFFRSFKNKIKY